MPTIFRATSLIFLFLLICSTYADDTNYLEELTIRIKKDYGDYFKYTFDDSNIYSIEKRSAPTLSDVCSLGAPRIEMFPISTPVIDSFSYFVLNEKIFLLKSGKLTANLVEEGLGGIIFHPRGTTDLLSETGGLAQLTSSITLSNIIFNSHSGYFYVFFEKTLAIYHEQSSGLAFKTKITLSNPISKEAYDFAFISPNKLYIHDKRSLLVSVNLILAESRYNEIKTVAGVTHMYSETDSIFLITETNIILESYAKSNDRKALLQGPLYAQSEGRLIIYTQPEAKNEAIVRIFDPLSDVDRTEPVINLPKNAKAMFATKNNLYVIYENWMRVYPVVGMFQFSSNFYTTMIQLTPIQEYFSIGAHDYLIFSDKTDQISLQKVIRIPLTIECKKELEREIENYSFQVRFWTTYCQANKDLFRFQNGSCSFTQTINLSTDDGFIIGLWQLLLTFVAGTLSGSFIYRIVSKTRSQDSQNFQHFVEEPKNSKRPLNMNRGLSRQPSKSTNSSHLENRKFMSDYEETVPSEEFRDVVVPMEDKSKKSLQTFETPRFTFQMHSHASPSQNTEDKDGSDRKGKHENGGALLSSEGPVIYEPHETVTNLEDAPEMTPVKLQESFGDA